MRTFLPRRLLALSGALLALLSADALAGRLGPNPANDPRLIDQPLEGYRYDRAKRCVEGLPRGTRRLKRWMKRHLRGEYWGAIRCERLSSGSRSVHSEGRAIDWHLDARKRRERRIALRFIRDRLLATDRRGNPHALARRMGVQGVIYDCRSWWSGQSRLGRYSYCYTAKGKRRGRLDPTQAHIDHIHIELSRPASRARTSFWRSPLARE